MLFRSRLRAGWRIALFLVMLAALAVTLQMSVRAIRGGLPRTSILVVFLIAVAATVAVVVARPLLDRKSFAADRTTEGDAVESPGAPALSPAEAGAEAAR